VTRRLLAALLVAASAGSGSGCATNRQGLRELPADDWRVVDAMSYAREETGRVERIPARWFTMPGHAQDMEGWWYIRDAAGQPDACGKCQDNGDHFRVIIYVGPDGQQHQAVFRHEAGHTMQTKTEKGHEPKSWSKHFERW